MVTLAYVILLIFISCSLTACDLNSTYRTPKHSTYVHKTLHQLDCSSYLCRSSLERRTHINYNLCTYTQARTILETLNEVLIWSNLAVAALSLNPPDLNTELILRNTFGETISPANRTLIVSRFQNIIAEIERGDSGRVYLVCVTDLWAECHRPRPIILVTHREANTIVLVGLPLSNPSFLKSSGVHHFKFLVPCVLRPSDRPSMGYAAVDHSSACSDPGTHVFSSG